MNRIYKIAFLFIIGIMSVACTDDFAELNTNPKSLPKTPPEQMLYTTIVDWATSGHYWIGWASKTRWMQYGVSIWGYGPTGYTYFSNDIGNSLYNEYIRMGGNVTNMAYQSSQTENPTAYDDLNAVAQIILIAKGIQTSDLFGSLVYSEGWQARNGKSDDESLLPAFQSQAELSEKWDDKLKFCVATLKASTAGQVSLAGYDRAYNGEIKKWIKAGNAVRLRLASRLLKRQPDKAKAIAAEVLGASTEEVMGNAGDSFIFWFDVLYTNIHSGDWHSSRDMLVASRALMTYMNRNEDPRRRMFFRINNLTPENIAAFNAENSKPELVIPEGTTRWEGASASRQDWSVSSADYPAAVYDRNYPNRTLGSGSNAINMRPANSPQSRLWKGNDNDGSGGNWTPVITYSDFCFLAAEFVLQYNVQSAKTAQQWYEDGVRESLKQWNEIGKYCDIIDYSAMTDDEIEVFMSQSDIKWNSSKALEQIRSQAFVDYFGNVDESWAQWKRTGYPNKDASIIKFDVPVPVNAIGVVPRRVKFSYPNEGVHNYENYKKRLDDMSADSQFGAIDNEWGRVWWDME